MMNGRDIVNHIEKTVNEMIDQLQVLKQQLHQLNTVEAEVEGNSIGSIVVEAKQSPFHEHPLVQQDAHTQNIYLTMLVSTLQYDQECFGERALYIAKIYEALNSEHSFETYFAKAKTITLEILQEFFITIQQQNFKKLFILEALVLLGVHQTKELSSYIVELASSFQLTEHEFSLLCKMAKSIVSNDKEELDYLIEKNLDERLLCPHLFMQVGSSFTPLNYIGKHTDIFTQKDIKNRSAIYLEGVTLQSEGELVFENLTELRLINCKYKQKAIKITVKNCDKVFIDGMDFSQHEELYWGEFQECKEVFIKNIEIRHSLIKTDEFFRFSDIEKLEVDNLQVDDTKFTIFLSAMLKWLDLSTRKILSCTNVNYSQLRWSKFCNMAKEYDSSINKLQENIDCIFE